MAKTKVTIDGKPVALFGWRPTANAAAEAACSFEWQLSFGVQSPVVVWELTPDLAKYVLGQKEVTLRIEAPNRDPLVVKRAVVIGQTWGRSKRRLAVQLGDIRRYLPYTNPVAALNERAQTGDNSLNGFSGSGQFIQQIPQYAYRLYSVNSDGTPVQAAQVVKKVMDLASQSPADWVLDSPPRATLIPNDIRLYEQGDVAVARMLGTIGGLDLYVDPADGLMHVKNRVMGDEKSEIEKWITPDGKSDREGWGKIVWRDERHNRPSAFDALYVPDMEFRTDMIESSGTQSAPDKDDFWSENVAEVMEYMPGKYTVSTPAGTRQSLPGEYIPLTTYLATMPNGPLIPSLTLTLLQAGYNNTDLIYGILGDGQQPDPGEESRVKSALAHYRVTMKINRRVVSRMQPGSLRAVMCSVSDAETNTSKPSDVYVDHCVIPTLEVALGNATNPLAGWNRDSFPPLDTTPNGTEKTYEEDPQLSSMRVAEFDAHILNGDAGLWTIRPRPDYIDEREAIVPCRVLNIPTLDYTAANNSLALFFWDQAPVAAGHRVTAILSAVPGVGSYHVPVTVAEASKRLGVAATPGIGPVKTVQIGPGLLKARFPWDDAKRLKTRDAFLGTFAGTDKDPLKTLVPANLQALLDYARGYCASLLANWLDHYEGVQAIKFAPGAKLAGSLHTIVHSIAPSGAYATTLNCAPTRDPFVADHFLSAATLAVVNGRVTT